MPASALLLVLAPLLALHAGASADGLPRETHEQVARWRSDDFDAALAEARRTQRLLLVDCQAQWCTWCRRLEHDTFADPRVARALAAYVCLSFDVEAPENVARARRYGVGPLPTLLFLDGAGALVDVLVGYVGPDEFLAELERIGRGEDTLPALRARLEARPDDLEARFELVRKLGATRAGDAQAQREELEQLDRAGRGYDPTSIDDHWRLAQRWRALQGEPQAQRHLEAIRALDPEGRSLALRSEALARVRAAVNASYAATGALDHAPLTAFLAEERHPELLFEGWMLERFLCAHEAEEARKRELPERRAERLAAQRRAEREAWAHCPAEQVASLGHDLAWSWYQASDTLGEEELDFMLRVAREAARAAPESAKHQDTLAAALYVAGGLDEALAAARRACALAPEEQRYRERVAQIEAERERAGEGATSQGASGE